VNYSSDQKSNRLRIKGRKTAVLVDGDFRVNSSNDLEYWLNEPPAWRKLYGLPGKITFNGKWQLTPQNDLELTLRSGDRLVLRGRIVDARSEELVFQISSEDKRGTQHVRLLKLSGSWGTDDSNKIRFAVSRRTEPDILTLSGNWTVNDNQQIVFDLIRKASVTGEKIVTAVIFSGYWQISEADRLTYIFSRGSLSRFDFKAQFETPNLYPKAGVIKYRVGTGLSQVKRGSPVAVCLYGHWRFSRKAGLNFDMEYEKGRLRAIHFGASLDVSRKDRIEFILSNERGEGLGGSLICARRFMKSLDADFFVRFKKAGDNSSVDAGITIPF
jgi:hypothetical protein